MKTKFKSFHMEQQDKQKDVKRNLRNRLRDIESGLVNLESDQGKIKRNREAVEITKKQVRRKIRNLEMELEMQEEEEIKLDQKQFELDNEKKRLKKEFELSRIKILNLPGTDDSDEDQ